MIETKKSDNIPAKQFIDQLPAEPLLSGMEQTHSRASAYLNEKGFPTIKNEEYKYTGISKKITSKFDNFNNASSKLNEVGLEAINGHNLFGAEENKLILVNGQFDPSLSSYNKNQLEVFSFSEMDNDQISALIGTIEKPENDAYTALNTLALKDGLYIHVAEGQKVTAPVFIVHYFKADEQGSCVFPRIYLKADKNSEATFIEIRQQLGDKPLFINAVTEFKIDDNAHIHHYKLQDGSKNSIEVSNSSSDVLRDATFTSVVLSFQGEMVRNNLSLNLKASNCEGNMYGLYLLNGETHVDNHTNVDHIKPHSLSNELYKGIFNDSSRGVFNGKIFVRQDAQKTNAFQQNSNILLSENATVNTKPQLEIWADDVKCSHGCTTGQLDEEALFYIRARGIGKESAKALLLYAFAGEVLEHIKNEAFKDYCEKIVHERLGGSY